MKIAGAAWIPALPAVVLILLVSAVLVTLRRGGN